MKNIYYILNKVFKLFKQQQKEIFKLFLKYILVLDFERRKLFLLYKWCGGGGACLTISKVFYKNKEESI